MNEFIVWDEDLERFQNEDGLLLNENLKVCNSMGELLEEKIYKPLFGIGLTDIDGKKIYADCSIVEFEFGTGGEYHKMTGYFSYNNQTLRYEIKDVNKREAIYLWTGYIEKEIKIIDTVQENKLGLIK
jgi:hypothetical protein